MERLLICLLQLPNTCPMKGSLAYDTETNGLSVHQGHRMFAFSYGDAGGNIDVHRLDKEPRRSLKSIRVLKDIWGQNKRDVPKIMHNAKFDLHFTQALLETDLLDHEIHDTMIMSNLLQSAMPSHALKDLAYWLASVPKDDEDEIKAFLKGGRIDYSIVPEHLMDTYQRRDIERTMLLYLFFYPKIKERPKLLELYNMEMKLIKTTCRMEDRGLMVDLKACDQVIAELEAGAEEAMDGIAVIAGERINVNSPTKLQWLLFDKCKLPIVGKTKKSRQPSTDKSAMALLRDTCEHPVLDLVLKYRSWYRGVGMINSYKEHAGSDCIIHPNLRTCGARTGRQSCSDPNLHNIEKSGTLLNPFPVPARRCFRPRPGYVNFHIDYSGIEFRLLAHFAEDFRVIKAIKNGLDPHVRAAEIFYREKFIGEKSKKKRDAMRGAAKNTNYAICYAAGMTKMAKVLGVFYDAEFKRRFGAYKMEFPMLVGLSPKLARIAKEVGYVDTHAGRRIHVPKDKSYVATNWIVQGSAADIMKEAEVRVDKYLQETTGDEVRIILSIHDELILEYPIKRMKEAKGVMRRVANEMTRDFGYLIPLEVDVGIVKKNWEEKKEFKL